MKLSLPKYISMLSREQSDDHDWQFRMKEQVREIEEYQGTKRKS